MQVNIRLQMQSDEQLLRQRGLYEGGPAERFLTHEVRRLSDPYVPFLKGPLKNTAIEGQHTITYIQPYARRWWYTHKGKGLRGPRWCDRMWADRGPEIVKTVANFCGGRAK